MDDKAFLGKRRDRAIATILSFKEREVDRFLPPDVSAALRKEVLDQINDLCDLAFDLMGPDVMNEEFLDRFDQVYEVLIKNNGLSNADL